ncbi:MAG: AAA family ATPase [Candidatus Dormibacteria bacterium]
MKAVHSVYDVFTPSQPAKLNYISRPTISRRLATALRTPGQQLIVYGASGTGKSTLLLHELRELYLEIITTRCTQDTHFETMLLDAFDQLHQYYSAQALSSQSGGKSAQLGADFRLISAQIGRVGSTVTSTTSVPVVPPQLTAQRLGEFMGARGLCWVLEDFHKVLPAAKTSLAQTFKVFSDLSPEYPRLRLIAIGATDTAREVVTHDPEMGQRVAEVLVPVMSKGELREILSNGQRLLGVDVGPIADRIVELSAGLASVCHRLALHSCLSRGINETASSRVRLETADVDQAAREWVAESSDTLRDAFDKALRRDRVRKFDNARLILSALGQGPLEGMSQNEILSSIHRTQPDYPAGNASRYLSELLGEERGSVLRGSRGGKYRFADPLYHTYARCVLIESPTSGITIQWDPAELIQVMSRAVWTLPNIVFQPLPTSEEDNDPS